MTAARNSPLLYDTDSLTDTDSLHFKNHQAVRDLVVDRDRFVMLVHTQDQDTLNSLEEIREKMQQTLEQCRQAVLGRTPYVITQERVDIERI